MKNDDIAKNSLKCAGKFITKLYSFLKGSLVFTLAYTREKFSRENELSINRIFLILFDALLRLENIV